MRIQFHPNFAKDIQMLSTPDQEKEALIPIRPQLESIYLSGVPSDEQELSGLIEKHQAKNHDRAITLHTGHKAFQSLLIQSLEAEVATLVFTGEALEDVLSLIPSDLMKTTQTRFVLKVSTLSAAKHLCEHWHRFYTLLPDAVLLSSTLSPQVHSADKGSMESVQLTSIKELLYRNVEKQVS